MTQNLEEKLSGLARLYELAQREKDRAELRRQLDESLAKNKELEARAPPLPKSATTETKKSEAASNNAGYTSRDVITSGLTCCDGDLLVVRGMGISREGAVRLASPWRLSRTVVPYSQIRDIPSAERGRIFGDGTTYVRLSLDELAAIPQGDKQRIERVCLNPYDGARDYNQLRGGLTCIIECLDTYVEKLVAFPQLKGLDIGGCSIWDGSFKEIKRLEGLRELYAPGGYPGRGWLAVISEMSSLATLDIGYACLHGEDVPRIAKLRNLTRLCIGKSSLSDEGVRYLRLLSGLKELDVGGCSITHKGAAYVGQMDNLVALYIDANDKLGDAGAEHLSRLQGLRTLNLSRCGIGPAGAEYISGLKELKHLCIKGNPDLRNAGAQHISRMRGLRTLCIRDNCIFDEGAGYISRLAGHFLRPGNLFKLDIAGNGFNDKGAMRIAKLKGLRLLDVGENDIEDQGVRALAQMSGLVGLYFGRYYGYRNTGVNDEAAASIAGMRGLRELFIEGHDIRDVTLEPFCKRGGRLIRDRIEYMFNVAYCGHQPEFALDVT